MRPKRMAILYKLLGFPSEDALSRGQNLITRLEIGSDVMAIYKAELQEQDLERTKFPYRFLLRWTWPDHIERQLRQLMWVWLKEAADGSNDEASEQNNEYLSDYAAMRLLWLIAVHPESPGAVLDFMARQAAHAYAERIAENPATWSSTLAALSVHDNLKVRVAVASNSNTSNEIAEELCFDDNSDVRYALAECTHRSEEFIERLLEDENPFVVARARQTKMRMNPPQPLQMPTQKWGIDSQRREAQG